MTLTAAVTNAVVKNANVILTVLWADSVTNYGGTFNQEYAVSDIQGLTEDQLREKLLPLVISASKSYADAMAQQQFDQSNDPAIQSKFNGFVIS